MKAWRDGLDAVRHALAEQDRALRAAYEGVDARATIAVPKAALRRLAEQCSTARALLGPSPPPAAADPRALRC